MEQNIKNFDRSVERLMNEQEIVPPFGAWNRIAAELDAVPGAAVAPPSAALIPRSAIIGFVAGALIIGIAALTAYMVNTSTNKVNAEIPSTAVSAGVGLPVPADPIALTNTIAAVNEMPAQPLAVAADVKSPIAKVKAAKRAVLPIANAGVNSQNQEPVALKSNPEDVGTTSQPVAKATSSDLSGAYYFPPIDVVTPEKCAGYKVVANEKPKTEMAKVTDDDDDKDDKKAKLFQSEQKIKFRPPKRKKFKYGHIIRQ